MANISGRDRLRENPFYVLGLRPGCTRVEVERQGQKLLGMLELKIESAAFYPTPLGPEECTPERVRRAMAELRDPEKFREHAVWAELEPVAPDPVQPSPTGGWPGARRLIGWGR